MDIDLEQLCTHCGGAGEAMEAGNYERCEFCNGAGYQPTEFGEKVLELMRHNLRPLLADTAMSG